MKRVVLGLALMAVLVGAMAVTVGAQTVTVGVEEWFVANKNEIGSFLSESSGTLTSVNGKFSATEKIGVNAAYTFGETGDFIIMGTEPMDGTLDISILQVGGDYLVTKGISVGGGYLKANIDDSYDEIEISGLYAQASAQFPLGEGFTLKGELAFSPFMKAANTEAEDDTTVTALEVGASYVLGGGVKVDGGYRSQKFTIGPDNVETIIINFSGLYLGATLSF